MKSLLIASLALVGTPTWCLAQEQPPLTSRDVPTNLRELNAYKFYPDAAARQRVNGTADVLCTVTVKGTLDGCHVTAESPKGRQFGSAVLKLAGQLKVDPQAIDGSATAGRPFLVHMTFYVPSNQPR